MPVTIEELFRVESRRVLATLIRLLGDFDLAEEALQDAFAAAVERWPADGVPANPRAWLISAGRFKAIDQLRRRARFDASLASVADRLGEGVTPAHEIDDEGVEDDRLRLIFTCCHPVLPPDAQIALTLREVCGLTTEEIAHAFLTAPSTVAQRIVRAKTKIRHAHIPYQMPSRADLPERLDTVLYVMYLVFNEGYGPEAGLALIDAILIRGDLEDYHLAHSARADLCRRLGRTEEARAAYQPSWRGIRSPRQPIDQLAVWGESREGSPGRCRTGHLDDAVTFP